MENGLRWIILEVWFWVLRGCIKIRLVNNLRLDCGKNLCGGYSVQAAPSPLFFGGFGRFALENVSLSTKVKLYALLVRYARGYISEICGGGKNTLHSAKINCSFFPQKARFFKPFLCAMFPHQTQKTFYIFALSLNFFLSF